MTMDIHLMIWYARQRPRSASIIGDALDTPVQDLAIHAGAETHEDRTDAKHNKNEAVRLCIRNRLTLLGSEDYALDSQNRSRVNESNTTD